MALWIKKLWYNNKTLKFRFTNEKKHGRLPKTKKLWFTMEKTMVIYPPKIEVFERIYSLRTLIYYWKLWYYGQNYGTVEINYGIVEINYGTIPKTMELWFTMKKLWYYSKL